MLNVQYEYNNREIESMDSISLLPEYMTLLDAHIALIDENHLTELDTLFADLKRGIEAYENMVIISEYTTIYGLNEHTDYLFGNESLISTMKDGIIRFVRWLWDMLRKLCSKILELLNIKTGSSKNQISYVCGLASESKESLAKAYSILNRSTTTGDEIKLHHDLENIHKNTPTYISQNIFLGGDIVKYSDAESMFESWIPSFKETDEHTYRRTECIKLWNTISYTVLLVRSSANTVAHRLSSIVKNGKLPATISEDEAKDLLDKLLKSINLKSTNQSQAIEDLTAFVKEWRTYVRNCYIVDRKWLPISRHIVTKLMHGPDDERTAEEGRHAHELAGVDVRVPLPSDMYSKLKRLFGSSFVIKRVIITNTRAGTMTIARAGTAFGFTPTGKDVYATEIFINYSWFARKFYLKNAVDNGEFVDDDIKQDRIDKFLETLTHECLHVWQTQHGGANYVEAPVPSDPDYEKKWKEYEKNNAEHEAYEAARKYEPTESDRNWVRKVLLMCFRQELASKRKH